MQLTPEQKQQLLADTKQIMLDLYKPNLSKGQMAYTFKGTWLEVQWEDVLTATDTMKPENRKYRLLCAQDLVDYCEIVDDMAYLNARALFQRINIMLFDTLRSVSQDLNILTSEYVCTKKA